MLVCIYNLLSELWPFPINCDFVCSLHSYFEALKKKKKKWILLFTLSFCFQASKTTQKHHKSTITPYSLCYISTKVRNGPKFKLLLKYWTGLSNSKIWFKWMNLFLWTHKERQEQIFSELHGEFVCCFCLFLWSLTDFVQDPSIDIS